MSNIDHAFDDEDELRPRPMIARLEMPFPLRSNFIARLSLPSDLTLDEVKRIAALLLTFPAETGETK